MDVVLQALRCPQCPVETLEVQQESNPSGFNTTTSDANGMDDPKLTQMTPRVVLHLLEDTINRKFFGSESTPPQTIRRRYSSRLRFKRDPQKTSYPTKNNSKSTQTQKEVPTNKKQSNESPNLHLPFTCSFCSCTFKNKLSHDRHVRLVHKPLAGPKNPKSKKIPQKKPRRGIRCHVCDRRFISNYKLLLHKKSSGHVPPSALRPCTHCDRIFHHPGHLVNHLLKAHFIWSPDHVTCEFCLKVFPNGHTPLRLHQQKFHVPKGSQSPRNVACFVCKNPREDFSTSAELAQHAKTEEHAEKIRAKVCVYCNLCRINFNGDTEALQVHLKSPQHLREVDSMKNVDMSKYCVPCRSNFDNKKIHIKTYRHIKAILFRNHVIPEDTFDVPVKCHACPNVFELRSDLEGHIKRNHPEYSCEFCGAKFTHIAEFHAHRQRTHEVPKPFSCSECGEKFEKRCNLISHKKSVHEGDPSVCAFCSKNFPTAHSMKNHVHEIHQRKKSRKGFSLCPFCPKEEFFASKFGLRKHLHDVHAAKYLQMGSLLPCKICYHVFPLEGDELNVHMGSHAHLQCKTCGRYLANVHCLKLHVMIHTGEKPYTCPHCEKKCRQKRDLKAHIWNKHVKKVKRPTGSTASHQQAAFH